MMDVFNEDGWRMTDDYVFFYGGFLSNFYPTNFTWTYYNETHQFFCTEQAFMWAKAKMFKDEAAAELILKEKTDPMVCKRIGRTVANYNDADWAKVRYNIMKVVNIEKYSQDKLMKFKITDPGFNHKIFVEASPTDKIWGIGIRIDSDLLLEEKNWKGTNLLGNALTEVRSIIMR